MSLHSPTRRLIVLLGALVLSSGLFADSGEGQGGCGVTTGIGQDPSVLMGNADEAVPLLYRHVGMIQDVPYKILYAIGLQESRRPGSDRPWPWTLNIRQQGHFFDCRQAALDAMEKARAEGVRSIDVGIGQVNLHWNGHLFASIEDALDPMVNLLAATRVLKREFDFCYASTGTPDWWCAVGRYHSGGDSKAQQARARRYSESVYALWEALE